MANDIELKQQEQQADSTQSNNNQTVTMGVEELKALINESIANAVLKTKEELNTQRREEFQKIVQDSVKNTQSTLMTPKEPVTTANAQEYVNKVISEDMTRRYTSPDGRALYSQQGEDFLRAKILVMKKIGLTPEQIAENIRDLI